MSTQQTLQLTIVSQERKLLEADISQLTAMTSQGEVTILPTHIPLFCKLIPGELVFQTDSLQESFVVSKGFMDVGPDNTITIMVDTAVAARDISEQKAEDAVRQAKETMANSTDRQELLMAEASLKRAMLELKVAQKSKKNKI